MADCAHTVTQGRPGEKGSWCAACGVKVIEVHDRPCCECAHFRSSEHMGPYCHKKLMAVTPWMHVSYYLVAGPGREGLCFEERAPDAIEAGKHRND